jgi:glycosyltransferase involved in cell wall biosynthesis
MVFKNLNTIIVTHEATTGPAQELRDFLIPKVKNLLFIAHPLLFFSKMKERSSYCEKYENGKLTKRHQAFHWQCSEYLSYLKDCFYTFFWVFVSRDKYNLFVGSGNINALIGIVLKKLGKVKKTVFYCIDYVPQRFNNHTINNIYHLIDKICAEKCDVTWNLSPRMIEGREKRWRKNFPKQAVVSHGVHFYRIKRLPFDKIDKKEIVFMGSILEKQGIQLVIKALPEIRKKIKGVHFAIIGTGPYEKNLKDLVKKMKLGKAVTFTGYIESHRELEDMMTKGALGVALYNSTIDQFTYYADPGKVKVYLGAGLPIIITDVPQIARGIEKKKCGITIDYKEEDIAEAIVELLKDENKLKTYRKNAIKYAKEFDWNKIFNKALRNYDDKNRQSI